MLKLDPKNTELLSQKQTILNKEIEETRSKLSILKDTKEEADKKMAEGTKINEENYRALQREIINTESKLKQLQLAEDPFYKFGKNAEELGNKISNVSSKIDNLGSKLTTRLTLPIAGLFTVATKEAIEFESAFTGVTKTVDGTEEQLENLKQGIKNLAKEIPSSTTEISEVAEAAGQLGIQTDNVLGFTKTMIDLGNATNMTADEAATTLARFANVTNMKQSDFNKLGSVIVALGNNFATTEAEITAMGMNLASAGTQVGMSQSEIMALATALSSVGLEAQAGGTAFSKVMVNMQLAVEKGGQDLKDFASVAGMSTKEFKKAFKEDASGAIMKFVEGLSKSGERGKSAIKILDDMGITETRLRDALLRSANASDVMNEAIELGNKAWKDNTALTDEANKRYATTDSQLKIMKNKVKDVATSLGDKLLPAANKLLDKASKWIDKLDDLSDAQKENIIKIGLMVAAAGPLLKILGTLGKTIGTTVKGIGTFSQAIAVMNNKTTSSSASVNNLAKILKGLTSPAGIAAAGITAAVGIIVTELQKAEKQITNSFDNIGEGASDFCNGIQNAEGYLDSFNSMMFASSEEQQKLQEEMNKIQEGITNICKKASDERRDYTQKEITQLDEYFAKLRELKNREIQIQQEIAGAIAQQAISNAENFQGSLEEYKAQAEEWISTAKQQAEKTKSLIQQSSIEEIALLNQRYGDKANIQNEAYATEYNKIMEEKQKKIDAANQEVGEILSVYSQGYAKRGDQHDAFYEQLNYFNKKQEDEENRHNSVMDDIKDRWYLHESSRGDAYAEENRKHYNAQKKIWEDMYKDMSKSEGEQLGAWLEMLAQAELYGTKISEEDQKMVDTIMESFECMPDKSKKTMKQTMEGMLNGMKDSEPALYAKASNVANGVISRLKKTFDIHSPSKKTREIFRYVGEGELLGLQDTEKEIYEEVDKINKNIVGKLNGIDTNVNMGTLQQSVIDKTRTIFTTPNIVINANDELTASKINTIIDTLNRRLGSQY